MELSADPLYMPWCKSNTMQKKSFRCRLETPGHFVQEPRRSVLGGIRKAPGGGGTLKMDNLHPFTPKVHSKAIKGDFR